MIRVTGARVLVKPEVKREDKTDTGIIKSTEKPEPDRGVIEGVGPYATDELKKGDTVMYAKYAGTEVEGGLLVMEEDDLLGVLDVA